MSIDQPPDFLLVLERVEVAVGRGLVAPTSPDLDDAEQIDVVHIGKRLRSGKHGTKGAEEHPQCHIEFGPEPFIAQQPDACLQGVFDRSRLYSPLHKELADTLVLRFQFLDLGSQSMQRTFDVGMNLSIITRICGKRLGELRRHSVVVHDQPMGLLRHSSIGSGDGLKQLCLLDHPTGVSGSWHPLTGGS